MILIVTIGTGDSSMPISRLCWVGNILSLVSTMTGFDNEDQEEEREEEEGEQEESIFPLRS